MGRIGEGEVSAWELGTGSAFVSPLLGVMNLIALSAGLVLQPRRMWQAFRRGCASRNLYRSAIRHEIDTGRWANLAALRQHALEVRQATPPGAMRRIEFGCYCLLALAIHAVIAIPAVLARIVTDITLGYSVFQAIKPSKRQDLY